MVREGFPKEVTPKLSPEARSSLGRQGRGGCWETPEGICGDFQQPQGPPACSSKGSAAEGQDRSRCLLSTEKEGGSASGAQSDRERGPGKAAAGESSHPGCASAAEPARPAALFPGGAPDLRMTSPGAPAPRTLQSPGGSSSLLQLAPGRRLSKQRTESLFHVINNASKKN